MKNIDESGRSMVEMLGVLAIIGVLSVGGVAGYSSAMNKHRANELLHQVFMRVTSCVAQIAQGKTPNVGDFGTYDGYTFEADIVPNEDKFTITIKDKPVSKAVCNNMKNVVGSNVVAFSPDPCTESNGTIVLTYSSELVSGSSGVDENSPEMLACKAECEEPNRCLPNGES